MRHLDFIVWMCAWPLISAIIDAIRWQWCEHRQYSDSTIALAALLLVLFYLGVGLALW
jgi:hypothetical protein